MRASENIRTHWRAGVVIWDFHQACGKTNFVWFDGEQAFESYLMKRPSNPRILERRLSLLISCQSLALAFPIQIRLVSLRMRWRAGGVIGRGFQSTNWLPQTCWRCWVFERKLSWWCSLLPMQLIGSEKPKKSKISERPTKLYRFQVFADHVFAVLDLS